MTPFFWAQKSDFCHTTPTLVDDPFVAFGETVHFPSWDCFFDFSFLSYGRFRKKNLANASKSLPPPHCDLRAPSASNSPSALSGLDNFWKGIFISQSRIHQVSTTSVLGLIKMFLNRFWSSVSSFWWRLYLWWRNNLVKTVFFSIALLYCNSYCLSIEWMFHSRKTVEKYLWKKISSEIETPSSISWYFGNWENRKNCQSYALQKVTKLPPCGLKVISLLPQGRKKF